MKFITKIYLIALLFVVFDIKSQDSVSVNNKFFISGQGGQTYSADDNVLISAIYLSYIPKKSNIMLSLGPSYSPEVLIKGYFGFGMNLKIFTTKKINRHNFIIEFGEKIGWDKETSQSGSAIETDRYSLNNLYAGCGYLVFLGKKKKIFLGFTVNLSWNTYTATYTFNVPLGPQPGSGAFSNSYLSPATLLNFGFRLN